MTHPWMDAAWSHIGVHETAGNKATAEIVGMYAAAGHPEVVSDEVPWCAAFVGACLQASSLPNTGSLLARSYLDYGSKLDEPQVGAIAVLKRGAPPSGHVGFVTGWGDGRIRLLGGNQGDKVCEASFRYDDVIGFRWPPVAATKTMQAAPLTKSMTIPSASVGILGTVSLYLEEAWSTATQTIAAMTEIQPLRESLATVGGNAKALAFSLTLGCLALVICRRIKAASEGKAG